MCRRRAIRVAAAVRVARDRPCSRQAPFRRGDARAGEASQADVHRKLGSLLCRGRQDGTIRHDVRTADLVIFGALMAQRLPHVSGWNQTAQRLVDIYIAGMAPTTRPLRDRG
ncbi:hypothetical protein [Streptomyces sp. L-9-10]|uniref:SbtR family transcriptional regulator n=1 Tax=Streptomyces sp. L-9-10 TaxID=1478131 RepID=UPI0031F3703C